MAFSAASHNNVQAYYLQIAKRDANGYPKGTTADPDSVTSPATLPALDISGLVSLTPATPTIPFVTNRGGGGIISETPVTPSSYGAPEFQLSQRNETFEALINNSTVDVSSNTTRSIRGSNMNQKEWPSWIVLFSILVTNSDTGLPEWENYLYLNAKIVKSGEAGAAQVEGDVTNPNPLTYVLRLSLSTRDGSGEPLSTLGIAVEDDTDAMTFQRSNKPLMLTTFVADGVETTFTLPFRPVDSDATGAGKNNITKDGVPTAVTSVSTTTGVVTLTGAGSDGEIWVALCETERVAI